MAVTIEELSFMQWLKEEGYRDVRPLPGNRWTGIYQFIFTWAIIEGKMHDQTGYENRWCYSTYEKAKKGLDEWDGTGEPTGWHRDLRTGRRRPDGDPSKEYVAW